ncbi:MAG: sensor histidine kinase, partial [Halothece sp.]
IPSEEQEKIFDSFYRGSNVGTIEGIGLGLATVKYISDLHQGKITVKSELGKGSTFTIYFPLPSNS